jgi:hypothetical protein
VRVWLEYEALESRAPPPRSAPPRPAPPRWRRVRCRRNVFDVPRAPNGGAATISEADLGPHCAYHHAVCECAGTTHACLPSPHPRLQCARSAPGPSIGSRVLSLCMSHTTANGAGVLVRHMPMFCLGIAHFRPAPSADLALLEPRYSVLCAPAARAGVQPRRRNAMPWRYRRGPLPAAPPTPVG